jgi:hypothetical protein
VSIESDDSTGVSVLNYYEDYMQDIKANFMVIKQIFLFSCN